MENNNNEQFGMTEEDVKLASRNDMILRIKSFISQVGPSMIKVISTIIYYTLKLLKSVVTSMIRMAFGKE